MGEEAKLAAAVKKTQESLGKFLKKPPLTEKLLKKPPFRFLHDIVSAVIKQHGLMEGLFSADELVSDNVKDKELKLIFLQKVIDTIKIVSGANLTVKPSKIVAGQEADKTNELLLAIAKALDTKVDSSKAVQEVLNKGKVPNGDTTGVKTKSRKDPTLNGKSPPRKRDGSKEEKQKLDKTDKTRRHRDVQKLSDEQKPSPKKSKETEKRKEPKKAPEKEPKITEIAPPVIEEQAAEVANTNSFAPSAPELSPKDDNNSPKDSPQKDTTPTRKASGLRKEVVEGLDESTPVFGQNEHGEADAKPSTSSKNDKLEQQGSVVMPPRPASTRPASAKPRPITARPAAPRLKERIVRPAAEEPEPTHEQNGSPEVAFAPKKDDDEDAAFVVEEAPAEIIDVAPENEMNASEIAAAMAESEQPHGHLVSQILGTKRELETSKEESAVEQGEVQWQGREVVRQEMGRLREGLQGVVRAVNPLARLLDFLQEDIESMQLELEQWRTARNNSRTHLAAEKRVTEETLTPLQSQLSELDKKLEQQEQLNTVLRTNILVNDQKMLNRLSH